MVQVPHELVLEWRPRMLVAVEEMGQAERSRCVYLMHDSIHLICSP